MLLKHAPILAGGGAIHSFLLVNQAGTYLCQIAESAL
jgi:hypothetical protein